MCRRLVVGGICLWAGILLGGGDDAQIRILQFARSGRNGEAIRVYESLPDPRQSDIAVLRAVAGCYWRERRFDEARTLYRDILERQSTLGSIGSGGPDVAAAERESPAAATGDVSPEPAVAGTTVREPHQEAETRVDALMERVASLERDAEAARKAHEILKADADQKMNDLLDGIEAEKARSERVEAQLQEAASLLEAQKASAEATSADWRRQVEESTERMARERRLAEAAAAEHQLREVELSARVAQVTAAGEQARLQVALLEQTLGQLRGRLDAVTAQLAVRDPEEPGDVDHVDHVSLALALDEIERLELELSVADAVAAQRQALLQERIETLEIHLSSAGETLATVRRELDSERRKRFDLEAQAREQAKAAEETAAMLEEAKAALARQYEALREHVQGGATVRLESGEMAAMANLRLLPSPDLVPMIGQLETATATAVAEVKELREQLVRDRAVLAAEVAEKEAELSALQADMEALRKRVGAISAEATGRESAMETAYTAAMEAVSRAHELRVAGLKGEIDALKTAVATRGRDVGMLEADLQADLDKVIDLMDQK